MSRVIRKTAAECRLTPEDKQRLKDLADVQELIRALALPKDFTEQLNEHFGVRVRAPEQRGIQRDIFDVAGVLAVIIGMEHVQVDLRHLAGGGHSVGGILEQRILGDRDLVPLEPVAVRAKPEGRPVAEEVDVVTARR